MSPNEKSYLAECPSGGVCARLPADCIHCSFHHNCTYKKAATFSCRPRKGVHCLVSPVWTRFEKSRGGGGGGSDVDLLFVLLGRVGTAAVQLLSFHPLPVLLAAGPVPVPLLQLHQLHDCVLSPPAL